MPASGGTWLLTLCVAWGTVIAVISRAQGDAWQRKPQGCALRGVQAALTALR
jgi:hypothetical protein